jgi:hypothetical protein
VPCGASSASACVSAIWSCCCCCCLLQAATVLNPLMGVDYHNDHGTTAIPETGESHWLGFRAGRALLVCPAGSETCHRHVAAPAMNIVGRHRAMHPDRYHRLVPQLLRQ